MFYIDSKPEALRLDDDGIIVVYQDGSQLKFTDEFVHFTNKYGDIEIIDSESYWHLRAERPTYDELYEHWLKTK